MKINNKRCGYLKTKSVHDNLTRSSSGKQKNQKRYLGDNWIFKKAWHYVILGRHQSFISCVTTVIIVSEDILSGEAALSIKESQLA